MNSLNLDCIEFENWLKTKCLDETVGVAAMASTCPIAEFFKETKGYTVCVSSKFLVWKPDNSPLEGETMWLPDWAVAFVNNIDMIDNLRTRRNITAAEALAALDCRASENFERSTVMWLFNKLIGRKKRPQKSASLSTARSDDETWMTVAQTVVAINNLTEGGHAKKPGETTVNPVDSATDSKPHHHSQPNHETGTQSHQTHHTSGHTHTDMPAHHSDHSSGGDIGHHTSFGDAGTTFSGGDGGGSIP